MFFCHEERAGYVCCPVNAAGCWSDAHQLRHSQWEETWTEAELTFGETVTVHQTGVSVNVRV